MFGTLPAEMHPIPVIRNWAVTRSPWSVSTSHSLVSSRNLAEVTRVLSWMLRRRAKRSATWLRYDSISGCSGYFPLQFQS